MDEFDEAVDRRSAQLIDLAQELVLEHGETAAAKILGLEEQTLAASVAKGTPSRRVRAALERLVASQAHSDDDDQRARLAAMERGLRELKSRLEGLDSSVQAGLEQAIEAAGRGPKLGDSSERLRELIGRVSRLERGSEDAPWRLSTLEEGISVLFSRVDTLDVLDDEIREGLDRVIALVGKGAVGGASDEMVAALNDRVEKLESDAKDSPAVDLPQRLVTLERGVTSLRDRVDELDAEVQGVLGRVTELTVLATAGEGQLQGRRASGSGEEEEDDGQTDPARYEGKEDLASVADSRESEDTDGLGDSCKSAGGRVVDRQHPTGPLSGQEMPEITQWREMRKRRREGTALQRARFRERVMELEIEMIGEGGLTLPPETEPLHPSRRLVQVAWRRRELLGLRTQRLRREALAWLRQKVSFGLWRSEIR